MTAVSSIYQQNCFKSDDLFLSVLGTWHSTSQKFVSQLKIKLDDDLMSF